VDAADNRHRLIDREEIRKRRIFGLELLAQENKFVLVGLNWWNMHRVRQERVHVEGISGHEREGIEKDSTEKSWRLPRNGNIMEFSEYI
jgi:hypothetical protein